VVVPVTIVAGPQGVVANYAMPVALSVQATGTGALQYQWFKNGVALPGQTSAGLCIPALTSTEAGNYSVSVTDANGSTSSANAAVVLDYVNIQPSAFDLWDSHVGAVVTAATSSAPGSSPSGMFGAGLSSDDSGTTYFADGQLAGAFHVVEWATPAPVKVSTIRLFARGDASKAREFKTVTLRAKSPGSSTFNLLIGTFTPTHPYTLLDPNTSAVLDTEITPIEAVAFRAEFKQRGKAAPRVFELDAFTTRPLVVPAVVVQPESQRVSKKSGATFMVVARGGKLRYQWKFNGRNIAGEVSSTLKVDLDKRSERGIYSVVVSNELGSVESNPATLTIVNRK
jgi:hypothetical protein